MMEKLIAGASKMGFRLNPDQIERFEIYYRELRDWNRKINLTAITGYEEVQVKHFLDSLTPALAFPVVETMTGRRFIDIGAGAGLPGIPLKIMLPGIRLVLLEATAKKADFLRHLVARLGLEDVEVAALRAETAAHDATYREQFDFVVSRAVAALPVLAELTLPFCAVGGSLIAQKKGDIAAEVERAAFAIEKLGGSLREVKAIKLAGLNDARSLVIVAKIGSSPANYPRRPGLPAKRPLGGKNRFQDGL